MRANRRATQGFEPKEGSFAGSRWRPKIKSKILALAARNSRFVLHDDRRNSIGPKNKIGIFGVFCAPLSHMHTWRFDGTEKQNRIFWQMLGATLAYVLHGNSILKGNNHE